ncbi:CCA tRNA nucleotidyltransferase [Jeotgalibacillus haloalkalitolerans]|uniref:CCA-adding enzyme n=1 Tax=Jeotgalibacillus haloalkalitolerans TaxID=3104292 RepID=A0ABU5KMQ6_9BACL|nr:CCA tRNA nucleotidyltransferase [Jeotgalibacillus sp. HH7-29]MDZ5711990.1 CCA tRNA nucleotidyltransferase [Jeotgalibacillus sp. HH7-29]
MNECFKQALPVLKEIEAHGFEAYFVGGCVRDYYLGRTINDIDIAVSATPEEIKGIFKQTVDIGIEHGTVLVLHKHGQFEVTTFRTEGTYSDNRRPDDVQFVRSLEEDLKRRDFTMNAMALSTSFELTDLFDGRKDLLNREIRTVGCPEERFSEDALRMLRAVRFVSQLDFSIEKNTYDAIKRFASRLSHVAVERMTAEFEKLLHGPAMDRALTYTVDTGIAEWLPELITDSVVSEVKGKNWRILKAEERMLLLILTGQYQDIKAVLRPWRMSNKTIMNMVLLAGLVGTRKKRLFTKADLYYVGLEPIISAEKTAAVLENRHYDEKKIKELYNSMIIKSRTDLVFKGTHLIKWTGRSGGPWVKDCTAAIEKLILDEKLNNHLSDIRDWVETEWLQK